MVVVAVPFRICEVLTELAVGDRSRIQTGIRAGLVKSDRIEACEHSDIRKDRGIVLAMAVTVGADILHQCNMEMRTAMTDSLCILCHLTIQKFVCAAVWIVYSIKTTCSDTTAAAFTPKSLMLFIVSSSEMAKVEMVGMNTFRIPLATPGIDRGSITL